MDVNHGVQHTEMSDLSSVDNHSLRSITKTGFKQIDPLNFKDDLSSDAIDWCYTITSKKFYQITRNHISWTRPIAATTKMGRIFNKRK